jgi:hypothetical protein
MEVGKSEVRQEIDAFITYDLQAYMRCSWANSAALATGRLTTAAHLDKHDRLVIGKYMQTGWSDSLFYFLYHDHPTSLLQHNNLRYLHQTYYVT